MPDAPTPTASDIAAEILADAADHGETEAETAAVIQETLENFPVAEIMRRSPVAGEDHA